MKAITTLQYVPPEWWSVALIQQYEEIINGNFEVFTFSHDLSYYHDKNFNQDSLEIYFVAM